MSLDRRVRDSLHQEAASVSPDVERRLEATLRRGDGHRSQSAIRFTAAAVGVLLLAVIVRSSPFDPIAAVMSLLTVSSDHGPRVTTGPHEVADRMVGAYRATVPDADPTVASLGMAGPWGLRLGADSTIVVSPPAGFAARSDDPLTGYVYAVQDGQLYTNLFARHLERSCVGYGAYRWNVTEDRLTLELIDDVCAARVALLSSVSWRRVID